MVGGHELTHGFDDQGSKFDGDGNLKSWWSPAVRAKFEARTKCVDEQYAQYEVLPGVKLNGEMTLGENIADIGGVKLNLASPDDVRAAFDGVVEAARAAAPEATIEGVSVQRMAEPGVEVIVGMTTDAQFGPVLMFGLGGILVEVLKDVAFRVVPLTARDASQMVRDIKGFPILEGYRGQEPADVGALEQLLVKVSQFVETNPQVSELDLNPVFAYPKGTAAVDARIVLSEGT